MFKAILAGGALIAMTAFYAVALPFMTAERLKSAVEARDADTIISLIDFESVRADLKSDLAAMMTKQNANPASVAFGSAFFGGLIDRYVQPEAVKSMVGEQPSSDTRRQIELPDGATVTTSLKFMRFVVTVDDGDKPASIVFAPRGLGWKVVALDIDMNNLE